MKNFYLIGLTGNMGSGKTSVRRILEEMGAFGLDADKLAHIAMMRGTPAWNAIVDSFGTDILHYNGKIDRQKLGTRVFGDPSALRRLEGILHPAVAELIRLNLRQCRAQVAVLEAIKLVETGMNQWCDGLWVVTASEQVQLERVMRDRQMTAQDALARLANQGAIQNKIRIATVVIDNSHDLKITRQQVLKGWKDTIQPDRARDKSAWLFAPMRSARPAAATVPPTQPSPVVPKPGDGPSAPAIKDVPSQPAVAPAKVQPGEDKAAVPVAEPSPPKVEATPAPRETPPPPQRQEQAAPVAPTVTVEREQTVAVATAQKDEELTVRRARRSDLEPLGETLKKMENRDHDLALSHEDLIKRLGERGYRIAVKGSSIVALAAWEAENLVAMTRDIWVDSPEVAALSLPALLGLVEEDARALQCEVSLLLLKAETPEYVLEQSRRSGYEPTDLGGLHRVWLQVMRERYQPGDIIWLKILRKGIVTKPI